MFSCMHLACFKSHKNNSDHAATPWNPLHNQVASK